MVWTVFRGSMMCIRLLAMGALIFDRGAREVLAPVYPNMNRPLRSIVFVLGAFCVGALFLTGCASVADLPATTASLEPVHKIALLDVREPKRVGLDNIGGAAGAFGLVGAAVQIATNADNSKALKAEIDKRHIILKQPLMDLLVNGLKQSGYDVIVDAVQYPKPGPNHTDDFSAIKVDADAILAVWFVNTGYMSPPKSLHYQPWVIMKALLIDAKTKVVLYDRTFSAGYGAKVNNIQDVAVDPKYTYLSSNKVLSQVDDAVAGLIDSEKRIGERINQDLAKKTVVATR